MLLTVSLSPALLLLFLTAPPCPNRTVSPVANSLHGPSNTIAPLVNSSLAPPMLLPLF